MNGFVHNAFISFIFRPVCVQPARLSEDWDYDVCDGQVSTVYTGRGSWVMFNKLEFLSDDRV